MRRALAIASLIAFRVVPVPTSVAQAQGSASADAGLLGAMKLWGDVRLFDPQVAEGGVDWDAAFMNAEPAIAAAMTRAAYAAAIRGMLAPLSDPGTQVDANPQTSAAARVSVATKDGASVITVVPGTAEPPAALRADLSHAAELAAKSRTIVFDLRDVSEANDADGWTIGSMFSGYSPLAALFKGDITLPRVRSLSYLGFPNQGTSYESGYSARDEISDGGHVAGKSQESRRFGFLLNGTASLPSMAIALAAAGQATIYTTGGQPAALSAGSAAIALPYGVQVSYRIADLAGVATRQPFAGATVQGVNDTVARLQARQPAPVVYASPPPTRFREEAYAGVLFPSEPMRMLAVARIFNVVRYFSPYRAQMRDDWEAAALQAIADERAATDARSYLMALMKFYAHLHDSHGWVDGAIAVSEFGAGPPLEARYLHRVVVVTRTLADESKLAGVRAGDVVDAVDGVPIRQAMDRIERYICASTPQSADHEALSSSGEPSVFSGRAGTTLTLRFRHPGGRSFLTAVYTRAKYSQKMAQSGAPWFVLAGNVGYVDFDKLKPADVNAMFYELRNTRAIVFDNRGYPLGAAWPIAPRLTKATSVRLALFNTPLVTQPLDGPQGEIDALPTFQEFYQLLDSASGPRYLNPTVMLIDERAISQSEHSALFFREAGHTRFVGTPTAGANGDVTSMVVPGKIVLYFSGEGVRWPDGRQLQRVGIIPDVRVEPTAHDVATGNDVVLQRGLYVALRLSGASNVTRASAVRQETARERAAARQAGP